uniref:8 kDa Amblyomma family member n=1 Tax=Rhipicephalus appendiculatus TaxID=34631 RepID=A0A131YSZ0_RHIAP
MRTAKETTPLLAPYSLAPHATAAEASFGIGTAVMVLRKTTAAATFLLIIILMAKKSISYPPGISSNRREYCNQTCTIKDDDSRTPCPTGCFCQAKMGSDGFPLYGQGTCVKDTGHFAFF